MGFEVGKHVSDTKGIVGGLRISKVVALAVEGGDNVVPAHQVTRQREMLPVSDFARLLESTGNDIAQLGYVAHVDTTHVRLHGD